MNRKVWLHRAAGVAALGLTGVALVSAVAIGGDLQAVASARDSAAAVALSSAKGSGPWTAGQPLLRRNGANAQIAVGEYLNGRLGELGLAVLSAEAATLRPLGGGLHLAEVRVQARGDAAATAAVANWIAVNREAVRLKSMTLGLGSDGEGTVSLVLLMVIA
ncbi:MAG: hypothetical protein QME55_01060 [Brevundimonas sp.]|uniref:hypothetical protein n=1 Tax=Brevundimonas sp. TaxID=1871086 RepID=UPI0026095BA2|nr:hypothetical protein [Brevundimonas sp.]MDI6623293.1 hypothetical protein [Brevundimonas sp.]MDQ7811610.1 hypothetical protein [Brevundimonas sp.]